MEHISYGLVSEPADTARHLDVLDVLFALDLRALLLDVRLTSPDRCGPPTSPPDAEASLS